MEDVKLKEMAKREKAISRPLHRAVWDYALQMGYRDMIYLSMGEPDFPTPPHIVEAAKKALDDGYTHYTQEKGIPELRRAIAEKMKADRGLEIDPENGVMVTSGGEEAIFVSILSLIDAGDEVIVLDPHYPPPVSAIYLASGRPVFVPVNKETLMGRTTLHPVRVMLG